MAMFITFMWTKGQIRSVLKRYIHLSVSKFGLRAR